MTRNYCPRCGGTMKAPRLALSRWDNNTMICPACGLEEALVQLEAGRIGGLGMAAMVVHPTEGFREWAYPPVGARKGE